MVWCGGNCLLSKFRKERPTFKDTLILQGGLNQIIFLFRCCFDVAVEVYFWCFNFQSYPEFFNVSW